MSLAQLTPKQRLVMDALNASPAPLSAYTLLDHLRDQGFRAPLQVYRALEKLVELGMVHRLESLNAFMACQHQSCEAENGDSVLFAICGTCKSVEELTSLRLEQTIQELAGVAGFTLKSSVIELRGTCNHCRQA
jgi:Fur family zinc uptake transcriptional regulator